MGNLLEIWGGLVQRVLGIWYWHSLHCWSSFRGAALWGIFFGLVQIPGLIYSSSLVAVFQEGCDYSYVTTHARCHYAVAPTAHNRDREDQDVMPFYPHMITRSLQVLLFAWLVFSCLFFCFVLFCFLFYLGFNT